MWNKIGFGLNSTTASNQNCKSKIRSKKVFEWGNWGWGGGKSKRRVYNGKKAGQYFVLSIHNCIKWSCLSLSLTHTHTHTQSTHTHTHTSMPPDCQALSVTHSLTHFHTHTLAHIHTHTHTHLLAGTQSHCLTITPGLSHSISPLTNLQKGFTTTMEEIVLCSLAQSSCSPTAKHRNYK